MEDSVPGNSAIVTFLGSLSRDPKSKVVGDLQLGDQKVTLNHLEFNIYVHFFSNMLVMKRNLTVTACWLIIYPGLLSMLIPVFFSLPRKPTWNLKKKSLFQRFKTSTKPIQFSGSKWGILFMFFFKHPFCFFCWPELHHLAMLRINGSHVVPQVVGFLDRVRGKFELLGMQFFHVLKNDKQLK